MNPFIESFERYIKNNPGDKRPKFTNEQINWICFAIGEWYLYWKNCICNYEDKTHNLGFAKEQLKMIICGDMEK